MTDAAPFTTVPREPETGHYAWYVVALLMLMYTSSFVDRTVVALLVGPIRADLAISDTQMSLLSGLAFALLYTTFGIPLGRLADRRSRRMIISIGAATWSLMTAACGVAGSFLQLFVARVGVGVGEASLTPAAYSLITDYFPRNRLARALGVYNMGISLGSGVALIFGGTVIGLVTHAPPLDLPVTGLLKPWQTAFLIVALPGFVLAALMWTIREPARRGLVFGSAGAVSRPSLGEVIRYLLARWRVYGPLYGGYSMYALVAFGFAAWIPTAFARSYGWTAAETGQRYGTVVLVFGTLGSVIGGSLADRLFRRGMKRAYVQIALLAGLAVLPCSVFAPLAPSGWWSLLGFAGWTFANAAWYGVCGGSIQLIAPNQMRGQATALMFLFSSMIGFGLGPTAIAMITDYGFGRDTALCYSLAIVAAVAMPIGLLLFAAVSRRFAAEVETMEAITLKA